MNAPVPPDSLTTQGLRLDRVTLRLGGRPLLTLDAVIAPGEVLTVMGPSGSGKSSLLDFVAGFLAPAFTAAGRVLVDGRDVTLLPAHERHVGLMFQDALLFPHLSLGGNLLFAVPPGRPGAERRARVEDALVQAGLEGLWERDPATLSGGQKARASLMRTLLAEPRALLLDEPFARLDLALRQSIRAFVFERARARALPVLLVTHDPADAEAAGGPVVELGRS